MLRWAGAKPASGIQAAAREARYRLLGDWCRAPGSCTCCSATIWTIRRKPSHCARRRSGADGLAGMAAVRDLAGLRLLRPFLAVPKARLLATLRRWAAVAGGSEHLAPSFARGRLRRSARLDAPRLARRAAQQARRRAANDEQAAIWLARNARIDPAGFVLLAGDASGRRRQRSGAAPFSGP